MKQLNTIAIKIDRPLQNFRNKVDVKLRQFWGNSNCHEAKMNNRQYRRFYNNHVTLFNAIESQLK